MQYRLLELERYKGLLKDFTPIYVQAELQINIKNLRYTEKFVPEYTENYTESKTATIIEEQTDSDGKNKTVKKGNNNSNACY